MNIKKFFSFEGRINRAKYFFTLLIIQLLWLPIDAIPEYTDNTLILLLYGLLLVAAILLNISVTVQRLHDIKRPGIHFLLLLIPFYNIYLYFVLLLKKGTRGSNLYGDDPLAVIYE